MSTRNILGIFLRVKGGRGEVHGGRPRPTGAVVPGGKKGRPANKANNLAAIYEPIV
jgi:hypothetical protein